MIQESFLCQLTYRGWHNTSYSMRNISKDSESSIRPGEGSHDRLSTAKKSLGFIFLGQNLRILEQNDNRSSCIITKQPK